jgi:hypothetical protein
VESSGAVAHVLLIAIPAVVYLLLSRRWATRFGRDSLLKWMAFFSVCAVPAVLILSTAVDRLSLYLYPIPMMVYANFPYLFTRMSETRAVQFIILAVNLAILVAWLRYANSASAYVPYNNLLFGR